MKQGNWFTRHKILTAIIVIIIIAAISGAFNKKETTVDADPKATTSASPEVKKTSLADFYAKVQNGQTKADVTALYDGREPNSCSESQSDMFGKTEFCTYSSFAESGVVTITYSDDKVSNKSKSSF